MLAAGTRLGPFEIGPLLGGGMGEVYRVRDERLGRDVAIKVLPAILSLDSERRALPARSPRPRHAESSQYRRDIRRRRARRMLGGTAAYMSPEQARGRLIDKRADIYRKILDLAPATHLRGIAWSPGGTELLIGVVGRSSDIVMAERAERK